MCIRDRYRTLPGLENVKIVRDAYAIEYDCINANQLYASLEFKKIHGPVSYTHLDVYKRQAIVVRVGTAFDTILTPFSKFAFEQISFI